MTRPRGLRVHVDVEASPGIDAREIERAVMRTLEAEGATNAEFSVALLDDAAMRDLNGRWLGKDSTTDVLAFALGDDGEGGEGGEASADVYGDVYVGFEQAARQAEELGVPLEEEILRLVVHGTLHVLGHDHSEGADREDSDMFAIQERLVRELRGRGPRP